MTEDEARRFSRRMIDTWPHGPRAYIWEDIATALDNTVALTAYRQLARETDRVSTAQFHQAYYHAKGVTAQREVNTDPDCETCDNTGWQDVGTSPQGSSQVKPCHCQTGASMKKVFRSINDANHPTRQPETPQLPLGATP